MNYKLIDDGECSVKIEWLDKKPSMTSMENFLKAYKDMNFVSSMTKTSQFKECATDLKKILKKIFSEYNVEVNIGHFDIYGFISINDKYCYFSIGDMRDYSWYSTVLYRTAEHNKDYTGGSNHFCRLEVFESSVKSLLERGF